jgi:cobalt-zinc-cadmium efflux system membrane fusion protein
MKTLNHHISEPLQRALRYTMILSALLAVGYAGHHTGWSFSSGVHSATLATEHQDSAANAVEKPVSQGAKVEFTSAASMEKSGIETAVIEQRRLRHFVKATGVVTYDQRLTAQLSSRASGSVWRVVKQAGDQVKKGDTLIVIDAAEVGRVKTELLSALITIESKAEALSLMEKNKTIGVAPAGQVREARLALRAAKVHLLNAEQSLINLGFCVKKDEFADLDDPTRAAKLQFLGLPEDMVQALDPTSTSSNLLALKAPFDGVLIRHDASQGEIVEVGKPVLEIANVSRMWLTLNVPKEDGLNLVLGQRVQFTPDGQSEELESQVSWINSAVDEQTRTLQIRAEVENPILSVDPATGREVHHLRSNTYGTGAILIRDSKQATSIPSHAIIPSESGPLVFVQTGDRTFRRVPVTIGIEDGQFAELLSGDLKPGQRVVTQGNHVLKSEWLFARMASANP